jgi:glutathione S-transferase
MIKLYGVAVSNFYNKIKLILIHKGIEFEEVFTRPSQEPELLAYSPLGKIPYIEDKGEIIYESSAITEYLDAQYPQNPVIPKDNRQAADLRAIDFIINNYLDGAARVLLGAAFFGDTATQTQIDAASKNCDKFVAALASIIKFKPYINSEQLSFVDYSAVTTLPLVSAIMQQVGAKDPLANLDGLADYYQMMYARDDVNQIEQARQQTMRLIQERNSQKDI